MRRTPGPWTANCFLVTAENRREVTHTGLLGRRRSSFPDEQSGEQEDEANASLIAAAPELLEALQRIVADWESVDPLEQVPDEINDNEHWDAARDAIAKATGTAPTI